MVELVTAGESFDDLVGRTLYQALVLGNRIGAQRTRVPGGIAGRPAHGRLS